MGVEVGGLTRLSFSMTSLISGFRRCRRTTIFSLQFTGPQGGPRRWAMGQSHDWDCAGQGRGILREELLGGKTQVLFTIVIPLSSSSPFFFSSLSSFCRERVSLRQA